MSDSHIPRRDDCRGEQGLDQREPRTRCWRSLLIRFSLSLGLIGVGYLLGIFAFIIGFSNPLPIKDLDEYLLIVAQCVAVGGIGGLVICIFELIVPVTERVRRRLYHMQVVVIGLIVIVGSIGSEIAERRSKRMRQERRQRKQQVIASLSNRGMSVELHTGGRAWITANPAGPPVTDAGLEYLQEHAHYLSSIPKLNLAGTKVTDAGIEKFRQSRLRYCEIHH